MIGRRSTRRRLLMAAFLTAVVTATLATVGAPVVRAGNVPEAPAPGQATPRETTCIYTSGAPVSNFCAYLRQRSIDVAKQQSPQPLTDWNNCPNNQLLGAKYADDGTLNSQLDWYQPSGGYYCFYFIGEGDYNDFDFDDYWFVGIRVWVCGSFEGLNGTGSGTGPEAQAQTQNWYYYGCGPQADDYSSYAVIDGDQHSFPYVHF